MILMIDNYDSFTYNLVQYLGELGADLKVYRNDALTIDRIKVSEPGGDRHFARPGASGRRWIYALTSFGVSLERSRSSACASATVRSAILTAARSSGQKHLMHGKTSMIEHTGKGVFQGVEHPFEATRYHSLVIERETMPDCSEVTA